MASEFDTMTGPQLLSLYNHRCELLGRPTRATKFRTKADGVAKLEALPGWEPAVVTVHTVQQEMEVLTESLQVEHETAEQYRDRTNNPCKEVPMEVLSYDEFKEFSAELDAHVAEPKPLRLRTALHAGLGALITGIVYESRDAYNHYSSLLTGAL